MMASCFLLGQSSQTLHADTLQARSYLQQAKAFFKGAKLDSALRYYRLAEEIHRPHMQGSDDSVLWESYLNYKLYVIDCQRIMGSYQVSLLVAKEALQQGFEHLGEQSLTVADIYNEFGLIHFDMEQNDLALDYYKKTLEIRLPLLGDSHVQVAVSYTNIGVMMAKREDLDQALVYYGKAIPVLVNALGEDHPYVAMGNSNVAHVYWKQGNYQKALEYFQEAMQIQIDAYGEIDKRVASNYTNLGGIYYQLGAFEKALENHQKALFIRQEIFKTSHPLIAQSIRNIGVVLQKKGEWEQALEKYREALDIMVDVFGEEHPSVANNYHSMSIIYNQSEEYERALEYQQKALAIRRKVYGDTHTEVASTLINIGGTKSLQHDHSAAISYCRKGLKLYQDVHGELHPYVANANYYLASAFNKQENADSALTYLQKALRANVLNFDAQDYRQNPELTDDVLSESILVETLWLKAAVLSKRYDSQPHALPDLILASQTYELLINVIDKIHIAYDRVDDKEDLLHKAVFIYEDAIDVNKVLVEETEDDIYLARAFRAAEKGKNTILLEAIRTSEANQFAGIPEAVLEVEHQLNAKLSRIRRSMIQEQLKGEKADSLSINNWQESLFSLNRSKDSLLQEMLASYPSYFQLKYDRQTIPLDVVQATLNPHEAVIEYFWGKDHLSLFVISSTGTELIQNPVGDLLSDLSDMRTILSDFQLPINDSLQAVQFSEFCQVSVRLYQSLISDILSNKPDVKTLMIVPDRELGYLPFEMLLTHEPNERTFSKLAYEDLPYLLKTHQIRYEYSSTLALETMTFSHPTKTYAGFAPTYPLISSMNEHARFVQVLRGTQPEFAALRYNQPEVQQAASLFGGEQYLGPQASLEQFRTHAPGHQILHLAMHAYVNDSLPLLSGLVFAKGEDSVSEQILYSQDLYNMNLNADLAVLSACETGYGKIQRGEGIMSLARAFKYAGCPNILMTLWTADDQASGELVADFFHYLKEGKKKDEALRLAKLDYLRDGKKKHPSYWANFVLVGDDEPLDTGFHWWIYLLGSLILFFFVVLLLRAVRKREV